MKFKFKDKALHSFLYLISGNGITQLIPLFVTPLLARLYSPENYGLVAYYYSLLIIITACAPITGAYGIFSSRSMLEVRQTIWANLFFAGGFSILVLIVFFTYDIISGFSLRDSKLGMWYYSLPLAVFVNLAMQIFLYWLNRKGEFKKMTFLKVLTAAVTAAFQIFFAYTIGRNYGLIAGFFVGLMVAFIPLLYLVIKHKNLSISHPMISTFPGVLKENRNFLRYGYPSNLINVVINQMPALYFKTFFAPGELGFLNMAKRLIEVPLGAVSGALNEVYKNLLTVKFQKREDLYRYMKTSFHRFLLVSLPVFIALYFFIDPLINIYLGNKWMPSVEYSRYFIVFIFFQFMSSPFSFVFILKKKLQHSLIINLLLLLGISMSFGISYFYDFSPRMTLASFVVVYSLFYLLTLFVSFRLSKVQIA